MDSLNTNSLHIGRRARWPLWAPAVALAAVAALFALGRPRVTPGKALDLTPRRAQTSVLKNARGELLVYNFRAVEPGVLYRASGFPQIRRSAPGGDTAAFADRRLFDFLRKRGIRTVVTMQEEQSLWPEQRYFEWWRKRTGYKVKVVSLPVLASHAYDEDSSGALRAASKFLDLMKAHKKGDGAVLIHGGAGKDRVGIAVALYELWRNQGKMNKDELWAQVRERYLESNTAIASDSDAAQWAAPRQECRNCGQGRRGPGFVCGEWLDQLRPNLELLAQL